MAEIIWTSTALNDLEQIHEFISKDSQLYANRLVIALEKRIQILIKHPKVGSIVPEYEQDSMRELIEGNYRTYYHILKDRVHLLRNHHSAKNVE